MAIRRVKLRSTDRDLSGAVDLHGDPDEEPTSPDEVSFRGKFWTTIATGVIGAIILNLLTAIGQGLAHFVTAHITIGWQ